MANKVEIIEVVHVVETRGMGKDGDPVRIVDQYWSRDGRLLAEVDLVSTITTDDRLAANVESSMRTMGLPPAISLLGTPPESS